VIEGKIVTTANLKTKLHYEHNNVVAGRGVPCLSGEVGGEYQQSSRVISVRLQGKDAAKC
jgi:hypothetical protein